MGSRVFVRLRLSGAQGCCICPLFVLILSLPAGDPLGGFGILYKCELPAVVHYADIKAAAAGVRFWLGFGTFGGGLIVGASVNG